MAASELQLASSPLLTMGLMRSAYLQVVCRKCLYNCKMLFCFSDFPGSPSLNPIQMMVYKEKREIQNNTMMR